MDSGGQTLLKVELALGYLAILREVIYLLCVENAFVDIEKSVSIFSS